MFIIRLAAEALSIADSHPPLNPPLARPPASSSGSNFLYSLLSGQEDASTAQQRSELRYSSLVPGDNTNLALQQKQRSNSVVVPRSKVVYAAGDKRPSSVPQSTRYMPYPHPKKFCREPTSGRGDNYHQQQHQHPHHRRPNPDSPACSVSTDSGFDEPLDLTKQPLLNTDSSDSDSFTSSPPRCDLPVISSRTPLPSSVQHPPPPREEYVQLARKMARPVQSHVSDWLRQMVSLVSGGGSEAAATSRLCDLPEDLRVRLLQSSWHRVLLLYMAEHSLRIVTSPLHHNSSSTSSNKAPAKPTQKFAEQLDEFISICSTLPFDHATYDLIRIAVILMGKKKTLDSTNLDLLAKYLTPAVDVAEFRSVMTKLVELDKAKVEALFCGHIDETMEQWLANSFHTSSHLTAS